MIEGVDYDKIFILETSKEASLDEAKNEFQSKHPDLDIVDIYIDSSKKRFAVFSNFKSKEK